MLWRYRAGELQPQKDVDHAEDLLPDRRYHRLRRERLLLGVRPPGAPWPKLESARRLHARGEDEDGVRGGLLERLQEGVERLVRQHVNLIDDVDLPLKLRGGEVHLLAEPPDVVDPPVRGPVDLDDVEGSIGDYRRADRTLVARLAVLPLRAVYGAGEDASDRGLSYPPLTGEQVCMGHLVRSDGVPERLHDLLLAYDLGEPLRTPSTVER